MSEQTYEDILYEERGRVATITFNRPHRMNAFRAQTYAEVVDALGRAGWNREIGAIVLTGAGEKAFGVGGDAKEEKKADRVGRGPGTIGNSAEMLWSIIRDVPKPVIAKVRGYAIGSANIIVTLCDMAIASETAIFGQAGPRVGSVDPFGTALLARVVGEKRAREIWYLCRKYPAQEALAMGLVNRVVPDDELDAEVDRWCEELLQRSPTAIAIAKRSFNADTEGLRGVGMLGLEAVALYFGTDEAREGGNAFRAKRAPDFFAARDEARDAAVGG
jgi:2-ketocyclohexanecarboxyl-CoA hydrolase